MAYFAYIVLYCMKNDGYRGPIGGLVVAVVKPQSALQHILQNPIQCTPVQISKRTSEKISSHVLTNSENLQLMAEKQQKKRADIYLIRRN